MKIEKDINNQQAAKSK